MIFGQVLYGELKDTPSWKETKDWYLVEHMLQFHNSLSQLINNKGFML